VVIAHFIARTWISKRAAAAILKFGLHFRYYEFWTQHVFLSLCTNLHQNRVVIARFIARSSISNMAAAAILKFGLTSAFVIFKLSMFFLVCVLIFIKSDGNCPFYSTLFNFQYGGGGHLEIWPPLPLLWFLNSACFSLSVYSFSLKSDGNCPFYSIHLNFQHGGGGHLESGRSLPVLHFWLWLEVAKLIIKFHWNRTKIDWVITVWIFS
jgi:hypothetical protein